MTKWVDVTIPAYTVQVRDYYNDWREMAEDNARIGHHWFEKDTMKWHGSKIASGVRAGHYFITSEHKGWTDKSRAYTIRRCDLGKVKTVGDFLAYPTLASARNALEVIVATETVAI